MIKCNWNVIRHCADSINGNINGNLKRLHWNECNFNMCHCVPHRAINISDLVYRIVVYYTHLYWRVLTIWKRSDETIRFCLVHGITIAGVISIWYCILVRIHTKNWKIHIHPCAHIEKLLIFVFLMLMIDMDFRRFFIDFLPPFLRWPLFFCLLLLVQWHKYVDTF